MTEGSIHQEDIIMYASKNIILKYMNCLAGVAQ